MAESRKHGPFDLRYPLIAHVPSPSSLWRLGEARVDWQEFLARFFPSSRRHAFDAVAAYESYRNDSNGRGADRIPEESATTPESERWEGEGGSVAERGTRGGRRNRHVGADRV